MPPVTLRAKRSKYNLANGVLSRGRQQVTNDLDKVIAKALETKLPKLVKQSAHRRVLLLERNRFNFFSELIFAEIERQRPNFRFWKRSMRFGMSRQSLRKGCTHRAFQEWYAVPDVIV